MKLHIKYICLLMLALTFSVQAQKLNSNIYKKYILTDTIGIHTDAVLILFNDQSYLNFGLVNNKAENDAYVWYSGGKWSQSDSSVNLVTQYDLFNIETLKKEIKQYYKKRPDYRLIESYYEFVKELFKERRFRLNNTEVTDPKKTIRYQEINT